MLTPPYVRPQPPAGYITLPEAAAQTGMTPQGLGVWCRRYPEMVVRLDGRWYFHKMRLTEFVATHPAPKRGRAGHAQG